MSGENRTGILIFLLLVIGIPFAGAVHDTTLFVGPDADYTTIQAAINKAHTGNTIIVAPGRYDERITISKSLTLKGATAGISKKGYPVPDQYNYDTSTESVIAPTTMLSAPVVTIEKGDVTLDGFIIAMTVSGSYAPYAPTELIRMTAEGALDNVRIENNVIGPNTNVTLQDGNAGRAGITISKWYPGTKGNTVYNLQVRNNKIFDAKGDGCGILMIGAKNTSKDSLQNQFKGAIIDNNEITGNHRSGIDFSAGVQGGPDPADHIKITNNIISSTGWNITDKDSLKWGNGIVLIRMTNQLNDVLPWASRYIDIENNVFSGNEKNAIYIGPVTRDVTIKNNVIENNGMGMSPDGLAGFGIWDGIRIDPDEIYQVEELARHPEQGTYNGQKIYDYLTGVTIEENLIRDNGGFGLQVTHALVKGPVDARRNWWGASSGPFNPDTNPDGTGDPVSANARFSPWYADAAKTQTAVPAGPAFILRVGDGYYATIQDAINAAADGDTIRVDAGVYDERIVVNRSVTLLGATAGIPKKDYIVPEGYAYNPGAETIISPSVNQNKEIVEITKGNVVFDGFVVAGTVAESYAGYPLTHLIGLSTMNADYTNVTIRNNVLGPNTNTLSQDGTKGRSGIAVYGPDSYKVYNLTISNNRIFDAKGDGCGILLLGSVNTSAAEGLAAKYLGSAIENNTITGNHRSGIEFSGGVQGSADPAGHFSIAANTITDNGWGDKAEKANLKYGNGIILVHVRSDTTTYNPLGWGSRYVDIENNLISGNEKNGVYIGPVNRDITITGNTIRENGAGGEGFAQWDGIQVDMEEAYHSPLQNNPAFLSDILVQDNRFEGNGDYAARVIGTPSQGPVDARRNWWGSTNGPKISKNPSGTGGRISTEIDFSPWYTNAEMTVLSSGASPPVASFTATPFEVMPGDEVTFDASESGRLSTTSIQSYHWKFGDGEESASSTPVITHVYTNPKVCKVTLAITDNNGLTGSSTGYVTVFGKKAQVPLTFNGTIIGGERGAQKITVNATASDGSVTNTTTALNVKNPGNGWAEMVIRGNTTSSDGSIVIENITEVVLKGAPEVTTLNTSAGGVGAVSTSIELSLREFADAPLRVEVTEGANATVANAFQLAAGPENSVEVAYTMIIHGSSMINSNLSATAEPVRLNMSVSDEWVSSHGGISAIKVIRYSDDGLTKETLDTRFLFSAGTPVMDYFEIISPHGCSIFGVAALTPVPQSATTASQPAAGPPVQYNSPGGGSDSDSGSGAQSGGPKQEEPAAEQKAPPESAAPTPQPTPTRPEKEQRSHFVTLETMGIPVYDQVVTIIISADDSGGGILGDILRLVLPHLFLVTAVIVFAVTLAFAIIWYGDRNRYWL
ncbi:MAG: PKD domain-containing protein [Methanomicrobiales archaeon]|nr:PKD domain-containing protein [Methanomicrobiales archaeon]